MLGEERSSYRTRESRNAVAHGRRALLVVTSHALLGHTGNVNDLLRAGLPRDRALTGYWHFEAAHLYAALKRLNFIVEIASPQGGKAPVNPISLSGHFLDDLSQRVLNDEEFVWKTEHTVSLREAAIREPYDAVVLVGGHGALFDFPGNPGLVQILQRCYEGHPWGIIAANGHGVAGLLEVRVRTGKGLEHLVAMKNVACFNEDEEEKCGLRQWLPYRRARRPPPAARRPPPAAPARCSAPRRPRAPRARSLEGELLRRNAFLIKGAVNRPHVEEAAEELGRAVVRAVEGRWDPAVRRLHPLDQEGRVLR
eukprot:tig00021178_g19192.t1